MKCNYEMQLKHIAYERQKKLPVYYKGKRVKDFICDFLIEGKVVAEVKAIREMTKNDEAQLINYLRATDVRVGILLNFGEKSLGFKRIIV